MDLVETFRANRQTMINLNPAQITITRTAKTRQGGGFAQTPSALPAITVRIHRSGLTRTAANTSMAGELSLQPWGLLADYQADLQETDVFEAPHLGRFRINQVYTDLRDGQVIGYQAILEKVT